MPPDTDVQRQPMEGGGAGGRRALRRGHRRRRVRGAVHAPPAARPSGSRRGSTRRATASAAPGTGTAIRARAATSRAWTTRTRSRDELQQEWTWTERYAAQPEILRYLNHVADRFDLRRDIQFDTRVDRGALRRGDEPLDDRARTRGDRRRRRGSASWRPAACPSAQVPDFPGLETFAGELVPHRRWPHEGVDFTGQRVGVIGTGSSGDPVDPGDRRAGRAPDRLPAHAELQRARAQRPARPGVRARDRRRTTPSYRQQGARASRAGYPVARARTSVRAGRRRPRSARREYEARWERGGFGFTSAVHRPLRSTRQPTTRRRVRARARSARSCNDPEPSPRCCAPTDYPIGTKRLCVDTGYYETFNRDNVDAGRRPRRRRSRRSRRTGIATPGRRVRARRIVFATGFDAMTGALLGIDIRGRGGRSLREKWADGPRTYLGLAIAGLPEPVH